MTPSLSSGSSDGSPTEGHTRSLVLRVLVTGVALLDVGSAVWIWLRMERFARIVTKKDGAENVGMEKEG
jgi:hypothetical protein